MKTMQELIRYDQGRRIGQSLSAMAKPFGYVEIARLGGRPKPTAFLQECISCGIEILCTIEEVDYRCPGCTPRKPLYSVDQAKLARMAERPPHRKIGEEKIVRASTRTAREAEVYEPKRPTIICPGARVKARDRDNYGTVERLHNASGEASVWFWNKTSGCEKVVRLPIFMLELAE